MQTPPPGEPPELPPVPPLAAEMAKLPGVALTLLRRHTADPAGYCRGCQLPQGGYTRWPCTLYAAATAARAAQRSRRLP